MRLILAIAAMCLALPVSAAKIGFLPAPNETVLMIAGEIRKGDAAKFRDLVEQREPSRLVVDGPGGDYFEALEIAQSVYMRGLATIAPGNQCQRSSDQTCVCASSCFFIWAAGRPRFGNRLVIHEPYDTVLDERGDEDRKRGKAAIAQHAQHMLRKLEVPEAIIGAVLATPFQSPRPLTDEELHLLQPFSYVPDGEQSTAKAPE